MIEQTLLPTQCSQTSWWMKPQDTGRRWCSRTGELGKIIVSRDDNPIKATGDLSDLWVVSPERCKLMKLEYVQTVDFSKMNCKLG